MDHDGDRTNREDHTGGHLPPKGLRRCLPSQRQARRVYLGKGNSLGATLMRCGPVQLLLLSPVLFCHAQCVRS
eukprot:15456855-Alexandrium_andersonii.AAC.1